MLKIFVAAVLLVAPVEAMAASQYSIVSVPCEEMLKEVRASRTVDTLSDIEKTRIDVLEARAAKHCDAGNYVTADRLLSEALDIMDE